MCRGFFHSPGFSVSCHTPPVNRAALAGTVSCNSCAGRGRNLLVRLGHAGSVTGFRWDNMRYPALVTRQNEICHSYCIRSVSKARPVFLVFPSIQSVPELIVWTVQLRTKTQMAGGNRISLQAYVLTLPIPGMSYS